MLSLFMLPLFWLRALPTFSERGVGLQGFLHAGWLCPRTEVCWDKAGIHAWNAWCIPTNPLPLPVCLEETPADQRALTASDKLITGGLNIYGMECASHSASDLCSEAAFDVVVCGWIVQSVCAKLKEVWVMCYQCSFVTPMLLFCQF